MYCIAGFLRWNQRAYSATVTGPGRPFFNRHWHDSRLQSLYQYLVDHLGYANLLDSLVLEVWRLLDQRPVQVDSIREMIGQIASCLFDPTLDMSVNKSASRLVNSLFAPTPGSKEDPGVQVYRQRLGDMGDSDLTQEAKCFANIMHDTGLASPYHAVLIRHLREHKTDDLIPDALWRQIHLNLSEENRELLRMVFGEAKPPRVFLLAGVLNLLGQPLGVGQGNNPSCQSAIGLSLWADHEADYLLQILAWAARDNEILIRFEGNEVSSKNLKLGLVTETPVDVDPVSLILIPHLDRIYGEMWRRCSERDDDAHRWINPEFYGWWVNHGFLAVTDVKTGEINDYEMRVYFFNPNNDSGQDWGQGVNCSTQGNGEIRGEASLPIAEFASRLCAFHFDTLELGDVDAVPADEIARVADMAFGSWAANDTD